MVGRMSDLHIEQQEQDMFDLEYCEADNDEEVIAANRLAMTRALDEFHRRNPGVYRAFKRLSFKAFCAGRRTLSASLITEVIRWETYLKTEGDEYKINNNFRAFYVRKFKKDYPRVGACFRTRASEADSAK